MTRAACTVSAFWLAGCSALVDPDTRKLEPQPVACQPGEIANCPCDGTWSTQRCNAGGGFDPCMCGGTGGSGAIGTGGSASDGTAGLGGPGGSHGRGK